jgi:polyphosphate kinase 2 (PPK2 family)
MKYLTALVFPFPKMAKQKFSQRLFQALSTRREIGIFVRNLQETNFCREKNQV